MQFFGAFLLNQGNRLSYLRSRNCIKVTEEKLLSPDVFKAFEIITHLHRKLAPSYYVST